MKHRDDMTFPFEEYERRMRELRERIAERCMDAVVISDPENIMYLTDYQTTGYSFFQALVVPLEGESFMITRNMRFKCWWMRCANLVLIQSASVTNATAISSQRIIKIVFTPH